MKNFLVSLVGIYRDSWRFSRALPLIFTVMIGVEFAQHVLEIHLGFFSADPAMQKAANVSVARLAFGTFKEASVFAVGLFAVRFCAMNDARRVASPGRDALVLSIPVLLFEIALFAVVIAALFLIPDNNSARMTTSVIALCQLVFEPFLFAWYASAALGERAIGPIRSIRSTGWNFLWGALLMVLARMPFNLAHAGLHSWARGKAPELVWTAMGLDAVVVGFLAAAIGAVYFRVASRVRSRAADGIPATASVRETKSAV